MPDMNELRIASTEALFAPLMERMAEIERSVKAETSEVLSEAERRNLFDADFHAKVEATAYVLDARHHALTGTRLDEVDMDLARHAAAVALVIATR